MTISSEIKKNTYNGNGSTTVFVYAFKILDDDEILVQLKDTETDIITTKVKTTDYTVSGVGASAGGNITFLAAPATGNIIILTRNTAQLQETDYSEYDAFPANTHEEALDRLTTIDQQQQEQLDRSLKIDSGVSGVSAVLPTPVASKYLAWNSAGTAIEYVTASITPTAYTITGSTGFFAVTASNLAALRTITGTSNEITFTNGNGVSGNPTASLPTALTFTGKTVTGGTFASITLTAPILGTPASGALTNCTAIPVANATGILPVANGGSGVSSSKAVIQRVTTSSTAVATGSTAIPTDDTIPQNTEGDQYFSQAITPTNALNKLIIEAVIHSSNSAATDNCVALFQDSTASAIAVAEAFGAIGAVTCIKLRYEMVAGTVSSTTFKIRIGGNSGTVTLNGAGGTRRFGGVLVSSLTITEHVI